MLAKFPTLNRIAKGRDLERGVMRMCRCCDRGSFPEHNTSLSQSVVLADAREAQVRFGADVPSLREETVYSLWVVQLKVTGCKAMLPAQD